MAKRLLAVCSAVLLTTAPFSPQRSPHVAPCSLGGPPADAPWPGRLTAASNAPAPLRFVADIPMPGRPVRFDYQSLDPQTGRLYVSHMDAGHLVVFDTRAQRVLANLGGFPRVTGVLAVPAEGRTYASVTGNHEVVVVDDSSLRVIAHVVGPTFPDGIAYVPGVRRLFVSDESGKREYVIDARRNRVVTAISLGGEAGNTQYDAVSHCVIVAVQTLNQLVVVDPTSARIVRRVTLASAVRHPHGVAIDAPRRLAFVAGDESGTVGVLDLRTFRLMQVVRVGADPDVLALDLGLARLYVAAESGVVSVFREQGDTLVLRGRVTIPHAHTVAVDLVSHRIFLPLENLNGTPVLRLMDSVPGSGRR